MAGRDGSMSVRSRAWPDSTAKRARVEFSSADRGASSRRATALPRAVLDALLRSKGTSAFSGVTTDGAAWIAAGSRVVAWRAVGGDGTVSSVALPRPAAKRLSAGRSVLFSVHATGRLGFAVVAKDGRIWCWSDIRAGTREAARRQLALQDGEEVTTVAADNSGMVVVGTSMGGVYAVRTMEPGAVAAGEELEVVQRLAAAEAAGAHGAGGLFGAIGGLVSAGWGTISRLSVGGADEEGGDADDGDDGDATPDAWRIVSLACAPDESVLDSSEPATRVFALLPSSVMAFTMKHGSLEYLWREKLGRRLNPQLAKAGVEGPIQLESVVVTGVSDCPGKTGGWGLSLLVSSSFENESGERDRDRGGKAYGSQHAVVGLDTSPRDGQDDSDAEQARRDRVARGARTPGGSWLTGYRYEDETDDESGSQPIRIVGAVALVATLGEWRPSGAAFLRAAPAPKCSWQNCFVVWPVATLGDDSGRSRSSGRASVAAVGFNVADADIDPALHWTNLSSSVGTAAGAGVVLRAGTRAGVGAPELMVLSTKAGALAVPVVADASEGVEASAAALPASPARGAPVVAAEIDEAAPAAAKPAHTTHAVDVRTGSAARQLTPDVLASSFRNFCDNHMVECADELAKCGFAVGHKTPDASRADFVRVAVEAVSGELIDSKPAAGQSWAVSNMGDREDEPSEAGRTREGAAALPQLVRYALRNKRSKHDMFLRYLRHYNLWQLVPLETRHVLAAHGERLSAAAKLADYQGSGGGPAGSALMRAMQSVVAEARGVRDETRRRAGLSVQDVFYSDVSKLEDLLKWLSIENHHALMANGADRAEYTRTPLDAVTSGAITVGSEESEVTADVNDVFLLIVEEALAYREDATEAYQSAGPGDWWTSADTVVDPVIQQIEATVALPIDASPSNTRRGGSSAAAGSGVISTALRDRLCRQLSRLVSVALTAFEHRYRFAAEQYGDESESAMEAARALEDHKETLLQHVERLHLAQAALSLAERFGHFPTIMRMCDMLDTRNDSIIIDGQDPLAMQQESAAPDASTAGPGGRGGATLRKFLAKFGDDLVAFAADWYATRASRSPSNKDLVRRLYAPRLLALGAEKAAAPSAPAIVDEVLVKSGWSDLSGLHAIRCGQGEHAARRLLDEARGEDRTQARRKTLLSIAKLSHMLANPAGDDDGPVFQPRQTTDPTLLKIEYELDLIVAAERLGLDGGVYSAEEILSGCWPQSAESDGGEEDPLPYFAVGLQVFDQGCRTDSLGNDEQKRGLIACLWASAFSWDACSAEFVDMATRIENGDAVEDDAALLNSGLLFRAVASTSESSAGFLQDDLMEDIFVNLRDGRGPAGRFAQDLGSEGLSDSMERALRDAVALGREARGAVE